ncbi:hypothetical protein [Actinomadura chokoriensis]|uniref:Uncharacterized protein n=1 Tax=Actinomadura chokoriensis TaxID=454156 RepID=A0ABV4R2A0_9ACTN
MTEQTPTEKPPESRAKGRIVIGVLVVVLLLGAGLVVLMLFDGGEQEGEPGAAPRGTIAPGSKLNILTAGDYPWAMTITSEGGATCGLAATHTMPPCSLLIPENRSVLHLQARFRKNLIYDRPPRDGFVWYGCDEGPKSKTCTFTVTRPGGVCITGVDPVVRYDSCTRLWESGVLSRLPKAPPKFTRDPVSSRLLWSFPPGVCEADGMTLC